MSQKNLSTSQIQRDTAEMASLTLEGKTLVGRRGHYTISAQLHSQPGVRIYLGTEIATHALVIVKEYYSFWWTASDLERIEAGLERLETIEFRSGGVQDFRLLTPQDVFASAKDQRCYLVLRPPQHPGRSLRNYLETHNRLLPLQVRSFLSQVLQTLWFLHGQILEFADGKTQKGTAHGNLTLDSVLMVMDSTTQTAEFQVYLQDLALWEVVVRPSIERSVNSLSEQKQQDLRALGTIAAQLLLAELNPLEGWNPIEHPNWEEILDQPLKQFIQQLIGSADSMPSSAKAARAQLLSLPAAIESIPSSEEVDDLGTIKLGQADRPPTYFKIAFVVVISGLLLNLSLLLSKSESSKLPKLNSSGMEQMKR